MTVTAKRYGGSLYELAAAEGVARRVLEELSLASSCLAQEPDYLRLLANPALPKKKRCGLLAEALAGAHPYVVNFLSLLCENGLLSELNGCVRAYRARYNADHNITEATVVSAAPLSAQTRARLTEKLQAMTGKTVTLCEKTDPAVLGGLRVTMDGVQHDGTVRRRLETLRAELQNTVL